MLHTRKSISCAQLKDLYLEKGLSFLKIGSILGFSARTIEIRALECRIKLRKPGVPGPNISDKKISFLYLRKRLSSRKIAGMYHCAYSHIDNKIKKLGLPTRTLSSAHIKSKRVDFSNNLQEKAYLIGFRIGDLRVRKMYKNSETIMVDCGSTKDEQIKLIKRLFEKYGRVWISKPQTGGKKQIECSLNESFTFLLKKYSKFPTWVTTSKTLKLSAIAGFIDAEGSFFVGKQKKYSGFSVGNYNTIILRQIKRWLVDLGFKPRFYMGVKKGYTGKDGYSHNNDYWAVSICRKKDLLLFTQKMIPYLKHKDRIKSALAVLKNIKERNGKYGFIGM